MTDLAGFLLARIAEDEALARTAVEQNWAWRTMSGVVVADRRAFPARVLAECDAKRRIIAWCSTPDPHTPDEAGDIPCTECGVLYMLVLPYAGHPEYDEAWSVG